MKNIYAILVLISFSFFNQTHAAPALNMDVADQNFNSTSKIVIDQDEIKKTHASSLPALLATKANISISTNNVQPNSIYIRGGDSSHVLILVDGVPTYDAASPQRTLNLFSLNLSKIKRIEILKGSQSVLYGGQAMSGVIKIETFDRNNEPSKEQTSLIVDASAARASANKQSLSLDTLQNASDDVSVSSSIYGLNAANNSPVQDSKKLYPQYSGAADLSVQIRSELENRFKLSYSKDSSDITNGVQSTSKPYDTDQYNANIETSGVSWILKKAEVFTLASSLLRVNRSFTQSAANNTAPPPFNGEVDSTFQGILSNIRLDANIFTDDITSISSGVQLNTEKLEVKNNQVISAKDERQYEGLYLKLNHKLPENFLIEYGVRHETARFVSLATLYHIGLVWNDTVRVEYSTGFKTPSLFQYYYGGGSEGLSPEKSKNFSASVEHKFTEGFYTSLTYFDTQFDDFIEYSNATQKYFTSDSKTVGIESQTNLNFLDGGLRFVLALGYQEPKDLSKTPPNSPWLVRRPLRTGSLRASADITSNLDLGAEVVHTGEKLDKSGSKYLIVEDYTLTNVYANYKSSEAQTNFIRIENIENKDYQTVYGFYNQGAVYKLGTQLTF